MGYALKISTSSSNVVIVVIIKDFSVLFFLFNSHRFRVFGEHIFGFCNAPSLVREAKPWNFTKSHDEIYCHYDFDTKFLSFSYSAKNKWNFSKFKYDNISHLKCLQFQYFSFHLCISRDIAFQSVPRQMRHLIQRKHNENPFTNKQT